MSDKNEVSGLEEIVKKRRAVNLKISFSGGEVDPKAVYSENRPSQIFLRPEEVHNPGVEYGPR
jgi:hypothetical protein